MIDNIRDNLLKWLFATSLSISVSLFGAAYLVFPVVNDPFVRSVVPRSALNAVVKILKANGNTGSGTVIGHRDGKTYILTNAHVVSDTPTVQAQWYIHNPDDEIVATPIRNAKVVALDKERDLALLEVDDRHFRPEAVMPLSSDKIVEGAIVYAVGAGLGRRTYVTAGLLSLRDAELDNKSYMLSSASIVPGNSGGLLMVYDPNEKRYEMIGVPTAVLTSGMGTVLTDQNYSIPVADVRSFLERNGHGWLSQ